MERIELSTFSLPWKCSATELHRPTQYLYMSGGRGRTCTCEGETPLDLQSSAFAAQPHAPTPNKSKTYLVWGHALITSLWEDSTKNNHFIQWFDHGSFSKLQFFYDRPITTLVGLATRLLLNFDLHFCLLLFEF